MVLEVSYLIHYLPQFPYKRCVANLIQCSLPVFCTNLEDSRQIPQVEYVVESGRCGGEFLHNVRVQIEREGSEILTSIVDVSSKLLYVM